MALSINKKENASMKTRFLKLLSCVLVAAMLLSIVPFSVFAAETSPNSLTIASKSTTQLAPGVTETAVVSYDKNGDRVKYWVVNANVKDYDTVQIKANYHDNDNTGKWGKATVIEQANAATAKRGYNVVVSQNAAYYNVTTGQPTGAFVMEGVNINGDSMGNATEFFAQLDDGTYMIGKRGTFSQYSAHVVEAIGGYKMLVWDGKVVDGLNSSDKYPRSTIGLTAEGNVVCMLADGNQKPTSAGLTYAEQAQLMLELGCVAAIELDGGGSATYASKYEGETELSVRNNCCDGTVRSVSNTFMIISTAVADGTFDHSNLSTEYAYYAPHSEVVINASGADKGGHAAEIPADVSWALSDDTFGTVTDGVFTSNGKLGTVTVKMLQGEKTVGSVDVTVVNPTTVAFAALEMVVPYGKTADLTVTSMYNGAEIYANASAFDFAFGNIGMMDGFAYTATSDESVKSTAISATYKYAESLVANVTVTFGKGSDVLFDFEDYGSGKTLDWGTFYDLEAAAKAGLYTGKYTTQYEPGQVSSNSIAEGISEQVQLVDSTTGKVHSGNYALAYTYDYRQQVDYCDWLYGYLYYWGKPITLLDTDKGILGTRLGMWVYIPEEAVGSCSRLAYTYKTTNGTLSVAYLYFTYQYVEKGFSKLTSEKIPEAGWAYVSVDMSQISNTYVSTSYYSDENGNDIREAKTNYAPAFIQWIISSSATGAEKVTFYIDDITLDYSDAVDDRDAPKISGITYADDSMSDSAALNGQTATSNKVSFAAIVEEDVAHNPTGIDASTASVYVDGQIVNSKYTATTANKGILAATVVLPNGTHDITFAIADKQGNLVKTTKTIHVNAAGSEYPSVTVSGEKLNGTADLKCGEQYNINITTDKAEAIATITTTIWLNSASTWALEHMTVAKGFTAEYTLDDIACKATITLTNVNSTLSGAAMLVSIPVYNFFYDGTSGYDAHTQWVTKNTAPILTLSWDVQAGSVTYKKGYTVSTANHIAGFGKERIDERTELNTSIANLKNTIGEWHYHTAVAVADKVATCTDDGFTGRMLCSDCHSIINWGTTVEATGHGYDFVDGILKCTVCGELFTGIYTDGKTYVDGIEQSDGWVGNRYYKNGVMLTGIQLVDGYYYDFGTDGVCNDRIKFTGLFEASNGRFYSVSGTLMTGWQQIGDEMFYFDPDTCAGINGQYTSYELVKTSHYFVYSFTNGKLLSGAWSLDTSGMRYYFGPTFVRGWQTIDGNVYYFDVNGHRYENAHWMETGTYSGIYKWYNFTSDGIFLGVCEGILRDADNVYYLVDGKPVYAGLVKDTDGSYYYISGNGCVAIKNRSYYITKTNGLLPVGTYEFGDDCKMIIKQGVVKDDDGQIRYYVDGQAVYAGLVKDNYGAYYYISGNGCVAIKNRSYYITKTNGLLPVGVYSFGDDCKMITE